MKLDKYEINTMGLSYEPEFHIKMTFSYEGMSKLIVKHNGYLLLDRYRVAFLHEYMWSDNSTENSLRSVRVNSNSKWAHEIIFVAPFSRQILEKFEESRNHDPKRDLNLLLVLEITALEPTFESYEIKKEFGTIDIAKLNQDSILKLKTYNFKQEIRISSSDWIHDFVPVFEQGKYQVFELPIPNIDLGKNELGIRLNEAIRAIKEMGKEKTEGEWTNVIKESRPIWELLRNKDEISELLQKDELDINAINSYNKLIEAFFDFSSKFIHRESKGKEIMINKANKEDAELIYSLSISIVNLITKKLNRI